MASSKVTPYPFPASILISREVEFGQVYRVSDTLVSIPDADRVQGRRTLHETRRVVIVQNDPTNYTRYPVVLVAPMAHRVETKRRYDIELTPQEEPTIEEPTVIRLKLIQPMLRADLGDHLGELSARKQAEIVAALAEIFGLNALTE